MRALEADARVLMRLCRFEDAELSLMIVGDRAIRRLNRRFRGKDKPTDVLSFPQLDDRAAAEARKVLSRGAGAAKAAPAPLLGDVVISIDTARRQARGLSVSQAYRLRALLIHGVLHLLGYDHERSASEARLMFARERKLAAALAREDLLNSRENSQESSRAPAARANSQRRAGAADAGGIRRPRRKAAR
jgi:rRNA maturation RNase YbeY